MLTHTTLGTNDTLTGQGVGHVVMALSWPGDTPHSHALTNTDKGRLVDCPTDLVDLQDDFTLVGNFTNSEPYLPLNRKTTTYHYRPNR